jgi:hypothetical protein
MFQPREGDGSESEPRLQFSSGDRQTDTVVKNVPEPLPAFALGLHHERRHGSKQESLIETVSYLRFTTVGTSVGTHQMVAIISAYFQWFMEQMSCRPGPTFQLTTSEPNVRAPL